MNNIKIVYYNVETINKGVFDNVLFKSPLCTSFFEIKTGLFLINYRGTAREMYNVIVEYIGDNSILIHDLESSTDAFWGFMNKDVWEWLKNNRN